ncbi:MAG TPA: hypothetical protein VLC51_07290 [Nitrospira sp.]|nr:hypothetical protein [Nitrospira sp.]
MMRKGLNTGGGVLGGLVVAAFIFAAIGALCSLVDKPSNPAPAIGIGLGVAQMGAVFGLIWSAFRPWVIGGAVILAIIVLGMLR